MYFMYKANLRLCSMQYFGPVLIHCFSISDVEQLKLQPESVLPTHGDLNLFLQTLCMSFQWEFSQFFFAIKNCPSLKATDAQGLDRGPLCISVSSLNQADLSCYIVKPYVWNRIFSKKFKLLEEGKDSFLSPSRTQFVAIGQSFL